MATGGEDHDDKESCVREASVCAVCLEDYRDPRLLPCLHTVCKRCILQLLVTAEDGKIVCPVCRAQYSLSEKQAHTLPKNCIGTREEDSEITLTLARCTACERSEDHSSTKSPSVWCENCKVCLCSQHAVPHVLAFASEKHTLSALDVSEQQSHETKDGLSKCSLLTSNSFSDKEMPLCLQHSQPLRMYCGSCDISICGDCTAFDHQGHSGIQYLSDVVEKRMAKVEVHVDTLQRDAMERLERALRRVDEVCTVIERQAEEVCAEIKHAGEQTVETVELHVAQMLQEVEDVKKARLKVLIQQRDELQSQLKDVQNAVRFSRKIMRGRDWGQAFFGVLHALEGRMASLISAAIKEQPQHHARFLFQTADEVTRLSKAKESIGKVSACEASAEHSVIEGEPTVTIIKGTPATFKLKAKNRQREMMDTGGDIVSVRCVACPDSASLKPVISTEDHGNGSYTILCTADVLGTYQLAVFVNGHEMANQLCVVCEDLQWDSTLPQQCGYIELSENNRKTSFKSGYGARYHNSVLGRICMHSGVYTWRIKIGSSASYHNLGVAPHQSQLSGQNDNSNVAYCWGSDGSVYYRDNISLSGSLSSWSGSDTFQLCLNCGDHTLQITNLRTNQTSMMSNLTQREYYAFASLYQSGNSVEFCV